MRRLIPTLILAAVIALAVLAPSARAADQNIWCQNSSGNWMPAAPGTPCPVTASGGNIGGYDFFVSTTPTIQNAQYVSGNCMGGFQAVAVGTTTGGSGILTDFTLISKGGLITGKQIYLFSSNPSGSTCTDKSTFTIAAADLPKLITSFTVTPAVPTGGAASVGNVSNLVYNYVTSGNNNLYFAIVETATETPASTSDLIFNIGGVKDAP
jgi:hypothetical protein